jgi:hypothetical protein
LCDTQLCSPFSCSTPPSISFYIYVTSLRMHRYSPRKSTETGRRHRLKSEEEKHSRNRFYEELYT